MTQDYVSIQYGKTLKGYTLEIAKLYTAFSNIEKTNDIAKMYEYDKQVQEIIKLVEQGAKMRFDWNLVDVEKQSICAKKTNSVVVCFSGGKDSTSAALLYKQKGYDVHLFYLRGINKSYPDEERNARNISNHLGLPLHIESVKQRGKTSFPDNPVKNQLIASMALDYAIENNIGIDIVFGDFYTDSINNSSFMEAWSDCIEMWQAYERYVRLFVPNFKVHIPFNNYTDTMNIVAKDKTLLSYIQSCVLPYRFRETTKRNNENKYGIELLPHRCGSCWKCCTEYIHQADMGIVPYNDMFYTHCLTFLVSKMKELRPLVSKNDARQLDVVYKSFLYRDFKESKYYRMHYGFDKD